MTSLPERLLRLALLVTAAAIAGPVLAQVDPPRDILIVLDNSGSMRKADPAFAMRDAVTNFASELGADDRVALVLFDHRVRMLQGFAATGPTATDALRKHLERLDYRGRLTDIPRAIERAIYELKTNARPGAERMVLFLTDGVVDTGNPALDAERAQWLRGELARDARESSVRIYSIAFTREADTFLVQSLAQQTGATYARAEAAADLTGAFDSLGSSMGSVAAVAMDEPSPVAEPSPPEPAPAPDLPEAIAPDAVADAGRPADAPADGGPGGTPAVPPSTSVEDALGPVAAVEPSPSSGSPARAESTEAAAEPAPEPAPEPGAAEDPAASASADGPPPAVEPALAQLTERLGIGAEEAEQLVASTQLAAADVLALVDEAGLGLDELRAMGAGETVVSRPGDDARVVATPAAPADDLALLTQRLGVSVGEAERLVDATQLPPADLLALLDDAGLTIEELKGLAVGETVVSRPGEGSTSLRTPRVAANLNREPAVPLASPGAESSPATPLADEPASAPADEPAAAASTETPVPPDALAADAAASASPPASPGGTPLWIILTTLGGIVALAVGALMALRPRGRQAIELAPAPAAGLPAARTGPSLAGVPDAWLSDLQRHSGQERIALGAKPLAVGRVAGTDPDRLEYLVVNQPTIGRRHAIIEFREFAWFITDQGSVNGTFVNGQRIGSTGQRLRNGDRVRFHRYEFEFVQPEEMGDHEATMIAQIPGEATLVADRTLAAASTAALSAITASASGAAAASAAADVAAPPATQPGGPSGPLDTHPGLGATGEPTQFNPAAAPLGDETGLDMFMASQVFGATRTPEDVEQSAAPGLSSDGSTVVLPGPVVSLDLPFDGDTGAAESEAGPATTVAASLAPADDRPFAEVPPPAPATEGFDDDNLAAAASAFDDDFFGTHELPAPPLPEPSGEGRGARGPADVFFPGDPVAGTGDVRPAARTSAPDQPPVDPQDDFFGAASGAEPAPGGSAVAIPAMDDSSVFFATLVGGSSGGGTQPAGPSPAPAAPGASAGDDETLGFFATVVQPGGAAPVAPAPMPPASPEPPAPSAVPPDAQHGETLRVRADSTVIMGGPSEEGPPPTGSLAADAPVHEIPEPREPGASAGGKDGDFDDFFNDDSKR